MKFEDYMVEQISLLQKEQIKKKAHHRGFKMVKSQSQQIVQIVQKEYANSAFSQAIQYIREFISDEKIQLQLQKCQKYFQGVITDDWHMRLFMNVNSKTHSIQFAKIYFYKKLKQCLITYKTTQFSFELLPSITKIISTKAKSHSVKIMGFGSHSKYEQTNQEFKQFQRGIQKEDLQLLVRIGSWNSQKIDKQIKQFLKIKS